MKDLKMNLKDFESKADVKLMVDSFYSKVRSDKLLGPIFEKVIGDNWSVHLAKMYNFWGSILFNEKTYNGKPFPPHLKLEVSKAHFENWKDLFKDNIDELFEGEKATEAKNRAVLMAALFHSKYEHFKAQLN